MLSLKYVRSVVSRSCNDPSAKSPTQNANQAAKPARSSWQRPASLFTRSRYLRPSAPPPSSLSSVFRFSRPFLRPFHRIPRRRELRRTRRTRRERFTGAPPRIRMCIFRARVCKLLRARRWFTANWFVNVVFALLVKERERERRSSHFPRVHDTLFVWRSHAICGYAPRKIGETFTSHI